MAFSVGKISDICTSAESLVGRAALYDATLAVAPGAGRVESLRPERFSEAVLDAD